MKYNVKNRQEFELCENAYNRLSCEMQQCIDSICILSTIPFIELSCSVLDVVRDDLVTILVSDDSDFVRLVYKDYVLNCKTRKARIEFTDE